MIRLNKRRALVVGGNSGIGLAIVLDLLSRGYEHVYIVGRYEVRVDDIPADKQEDFNGKTEMHTLNLVNCQYELFGSITDVDTLIITAGFGRIAPFESLSEAEISNLIKVNEISAIQIARKYYSRIKSDEKFYCAIIGSIAGHVASPLLAIYGASKMGLCGFIESVNAELEATGNKNRILDASPGSLKGTNFDGKGNNLDLVADVAHEIVNKMLNSETLYIPQYDEVYKSVIERYHNDPHRFSLESYKFKAGGRRINDKPQVVVGYLSGTFDLFHIGHLNLLRRAKEQCDYLVVGVHKSGAWKGKETFIPFEERLAIIESVKYVDKVLESFTEDSDAWDVVHYDKLFVGSDYKGSERFQRYEEYFKDKGVKIVYFPYTEGTSSTQLRKVLSMEKSMPLSKISLLRNQ